MKAKNNMKRKATYYFTSETIELLREAAYKLNRNKSLIAEEAIQKFLKQKGIGR